MDRFLLTAGAMLVLLACTAPSDSLADAFAEASATTGVPVEVLLATSWELSRFDQRAGEPNREGGVGVMNLRESADFPSLDAAAEALGVQPDALRDEAAANVAGGAALLAAEARAEGADPTSIEAIQTAVAGFSGASDPAIAAAFADRVYDSIEDGFTAVTPDGETMILPPTPLPWRSHREAVAGSSLVDTHSWACSSNYSSASRGVGDIDTVVIHTTQGSYSGSVSWFQNCSAEVSAHYVIRSSDGAINQSVDEADVAWHAGDHTTNWDSIGIEHEGYISDPDTWYTDAMYRASAALTADICDRYGIPKDRDHIIGHSEVPGCSSGYGGGSGCHTDPGTGWDWDYYMCLVNGSSGSGGMQTCYADDDGDGYGDADSPTTSCGGCPAGTTEDDTDCDDGDRAVNPGATELCDAVDNDCQGGVDEGYDVDDDGWRTCDGDCADDDAGRHPGATEVVDGGDDDCDWKVDEGSTVFDDDGDGWTEAAGDCDDADAFTFPAAPEMADGEDDDCDGVADDGTRVSDDDGDGWSEVTGDCDDGDATVHPGQDEVADGLDSDCDGRTDEGTTVFDDDGDSFSEAAGDCSDTNRLAWPGAPELPDGVDNDCDGVIDDRTERFDDDLDGWTELDGDCDDTSPDVHPGAEEREDGLDEDCNFYADDRTDAFDDDHDGWTEADGDCDDAAPGTFPAALERLDGADNDCDGLLDDRTDAWDDDEDGWTEAEGDCDDACGDAFPGAPEALDAVDNDCDGFVDDETEAWDDDGDGWSEARGDCDDGDAHTFPGAREQVDGYDSDCDGVTEHVEGWFGCSSAPAGGPWILAAMLGLLRRR